jgi:hypothetical protein
VNWIQVAQDRAHFRAVVSAVIEKLVSLQRRGIQAYSASEDLLAFLQEAPCCLMLANTDETSCNKCFPQNIIGENRGREFMRGRLAKIAQRRQRHGLVVF